MLTPSALEVAEQIVADHLWLAATIVILPLVLALGLLFDLGGMRQPLLDRVRGPLSVTRLRFALWVALARLRLWYVVLMGRALRAGLRAGWPVASSARPGVIRIELLMRGVEAGWSVGRRRIAETERAIAASKIPRAAR